jgi:hypothetical protein
MMFAAKEYFEQPDRLPPEVDSSSEVTSPAEYDSIGNTIRAYQTSQMIESEIQFLGTIGFWSDVIDIEQSMAEIRRSVDDGELVPVALGLAGEMGGHQVLVYDYEETGDGNIEFYVYDPQLRADWYETSSITLEVDGSTGEPINGYNLPPNRCAFYNRYVPINPDRVPQEAGIENPDELLTEFLGDVVLGRLHSLASADVEFSHPNSPASADVDPAADTETVPIEGDTGSYSGILSDAAMILDAVPGSYRIQVRGESDSEFTLEVYGDTDDGGHIATEVSDDIGVGESKAFTAEVPDKEGEDGEITTGPIDNGPSATDNDGSGNQDSADDGGPGLGVGSALAGIGGAAYVLKRKVNQNQTDSE